MKLTKFYLAVLFSAALMLAVEGPAGAVEGDFWGGFDEAGNFLIGDSGGEGEPFGVDPPLLGPWWEYPLFDWWNIWWYNHKFDYCRRKIVGLDMWVVPFVPGVPSWIAITINWSTDQWSTNPPLDVDPSQQPPVPGWPFPPGTPGYYDPEEYIGRLWTVEPIYQWRYDIDIVSPAPPIHILWPNAWPAVPPLELPIPYNPEWVSIDIRGQNVWILNNVAAPGFVPPPWDDPIYRSYLFHDCVLCDDLEDPVADAGDDQCVDEGIDVYFDGSGSRDDCGIIAWDWEIKDPTGASVTTASGVKPVVPGLSAGTYTVELTVTDCDSKTGTDSMTLCVDGADPTAEAGDAQNGFSFQPVTLDGSASTDDCGITDWDWSLDNGVNPPFAASGESPQLTLPKGTYNVTLTVTDCVGKTDTDNGTVEIPCFISTAASGAAMGFPAVLTLLLSVSIIGLRDLRKFG